MKDSEHISALPVVRFVNAFLNEGTCPRCWHKLQVAEIGFYCIGCRMVIYSGISSGLLVDYGVDPWAAGIQTEEISIPAHGMVDVHIDGNSREGFRVSNWSSVGTTDNGIEVWIGDRPDFSTTRRDVERRIRNIYGISFTSPSDVLRNTGT